MTSGHTPIPAATSQLAPSSTASRKPISAKKAQEAANRAGMSVINASALRSTGVLGQFIKQAGAVHIGRGMLAFAAERLKHAMDVADGLVGDDALDPETKLSAIRIAKELASEYAATATSLIDSVGSEPEVKEAATRRPGFAFGVVVNNQAAPQQPQKQDVPI